MKSTESEPVLDFENLWSSGKTCQESCPQPTMRLDAFWRDLPGKMTRLSRQGKGGRTLVVCLDPSEQSSGGSWTPNFSVWPNDVSVCSLSQVLEKGSIPSRYFLSAKLCAGILRRAEKIGKPLPGKLKTILTRIAEGTPVEVCDGGDTATCYAIRTAQTGALGHGYSKELAHTLDRSAGQAVVPNVNVQVSEGHPFTRVAATIMAGASRDYNAAKAFKGEHLVWHTIEPGIASRVGGHTYENISGTLRSNAGDNAMSVTDPVNEVIRRLTPVECERLMGFPDGYSDIPGATDAQRYKALGNSWAVNVVRWIGKRLAKNL